jgi:hypothetical protein
MRSVVLRFNWLGRLKRLYHLYSGVRAVCRGAGRGSEQIAATFLVLGPLMLCRGGSAVAARDALSGNGVGAGLQQWLELRCALE